MAITDKERDQIRTYLGFPRLYISANPFLEQAMTTIQSIADGGSAPDGSIEDAVRAALGIIDGIDGYIGKVSSQFINLAVYEVPVSLSNGATLKQDYRAALSTLRREGTHHIMKIEIRLGVKSLRPYFYSDGLQTDARSSYMPGFYK